EPATKADLSQGLDDLEKRLRAELASKADLKALEDRLRRDLASKDDLAPLASKDDLTALEQRVDTKMGAMENRLLREIGRAVSFGDEQIGSMVWLRENKYKALPVPGGVLEGDVADLKGRPTPPPAATPKGKAATKRSAPPSRGKKAVR